MLANAACVARLLGDDSRDDGAFESTDTAGSASISVGDSAPSGDEAPSGDDEAAEGEGDVDDGNQDEGATPPDVSSAGCGEGELCLQEASRSEVGSVPDDIAVVDLDEDGWLDLAVANSGSDDVSLLHGFGDGTFTDIAVVPICVGPRSVAAADFDVDGHADLVFACADDSLVFIMLGDGTGSFPATTTYESPYSPMRVFAAQFDGDGRPDVLLANYYGAIPQNAASYSVLTQPTAMAFVESANIADQLYARPGFPAFGDVDLDGDLDIVAAGRVAFGDGNGTFAQSAVFDRNPGGTYALHDIDGDGVLDLAQLAGYEIDIAMSAGTGAGDFVDAGGLQDASLPSLLEFGDLDGDGGPDLVTTGEGGLRAWRRETGFAFAGPWTFDPANDLRGLVVVDLNADGLDDVLVASATTREVIALLSSK
jgi:hypothetical protein